MTPRSITVRALVLVVIACFVVATWALRLILSPGDEGFFALLVYMPVMAAPGWLAWHRPHALRWLGLWSIIGWIATCVYALPGPPYEYNTPPPDWDYVAVPVDIGRSLVLYVVPMIALLLQAVRVTPTTPIRARIRRISILATLLGLAAVVSLHLPPQARAADTISAFVLVVLAPGVLVLRDPISVRPIAWSLWAALCGAISTLVGRFSLGVDWQWPLVTSTIGMMLVLVFVGIPLAMVLREPPDLPEARIRD